MPQKGGFRCPMTYVRNDPCFGWNFGLVLGGLTFKNRGDPFGFQVYINTSSIHTLPEILIEMGPSDSLVPFLTNNTSFSGGLSAGFHDVR